MRNKKKRLICFLFLLCFLAVMVIFHSDEKFASASNFGVHLGEYKGVVAYSNGNSHEVNGPYEKFGYQFQCVEYVNRFYVEALGWKNMKGSGNGNNYFGKASNNGLEAHFNGGTVLPQPDDLLTFSGGDYGHVAIVTNVGNDYIDIIEQNWSSTSSTRRFKLIKEGNNYKVDSRGKYQVQGWLRIPGHKTDTQTINSPTHNSPPPPQNTYPLNHIGWLDAHDNHPHSTFLSGGDFGGSVKGVYLATNAPDQDIHYYGSWKGNQVHEGRAMDHLTEIMGRGKQVQDMATGKFGGGNKNYLAVIYKGSDLVYFYYNNQRVGVVNTHDGRPQASKLAAGDVDKDGSDELFVTTSSDDHIYMFDGWHENGAMGFTLNKIENNWLDAHGGNPEISAMACMDIDGNGYDELMVATSGDDHIYEYFYVGDFSWRMERTGVNFHKQGYVNGAEDNAVTRTMTVGQFRGPDGVRDYLAVLTSGSREKVRFYWERDLGNSRGGILSKSGFISAPDGKALVDLAAYDINGQSEGEELITATEGNDHINFFGDRIGGRGGNDEKLFDAKTISQSNKKILMKPGQKKGLWIEYRNSGDATWYADGYRSPCLVTDKTLKRNSAFSNGYWPEQWQAASQPKDKIVPGEKTKYNFKIESPKVSGKYNESFALHNGENNNLYKNSKANFEIIVDGDPPTRAKNLQGDIKKSYWQDLITSDPTPSFKWDKATDSLSGLAGYYAAIDDNTPDGGNKLDFWISNKTSWTSPEKLPEGRHTFAVTSKDKAGNVNPDNTNKKGDAPYLDFIVDLTPPNQAKNLRPNEEKSKWVETDKGIKSTDDSMPTFIWEAGSDDLSGLAGYYISIDDENPDGEGNYDFRIDSSTSWVSPKELPEGKHIVYLTAFDRAGHKAEKPLSYQFIIDLSAPSANIEINNNNEFTKESSATLTINAEDISPITEFRLSNNGKNWKTYKNFENGNLNKEIAWDLENTDGTKIVFAQFKDALGHYSEPVLDTIFLDTNLPSSWINDLSDWQNSLSFLVSWFGLDTLSGIKRFDVQYKDSIANTWTDWLINTALSSKIFNGLDGVTYYFRSRAEDKAGNREEYPDNEDTKTIVDITAPDPPEISSPERNGIFNASIDENGSMAGIQVTVTGTAEINSDIVLINISDNLKSYSAKTDEGGNWNIGNVNLIEGENIIEAEAFDAAGNSNTSGEHKIFLDTIEPNNITDLEISGTTYHSLTLEWTAPGDDLNSGTANAYDVRYSASEINETNFESAIQIASPLLPEAAGTHQTFIIDGLDSKETYYAAIKTSDEANNWSVISNVVNADTPTSADRIVLISSEDTIMAEGEEQVILTATTYNPEGTTGPKLSGEPVVISITGDNGVIGETGAVSPVTDNGDGTYSSIYTAATKIGDGGIEITAENTSCASQKTSIININLIPGNPAGTINLTATPNNLDANGSTTSIISSDVIYDKTGNIVTDGQKITVNSNLGQITSPDQDASLPGIQVLTTSGLIQFDLRSEVWNGYGQSEIANTISAQSAQGAATGNIGVIFRDVTVPSAPQIERPSNNTRINDNTPAISGRAEKNSRVLIYKKRGSGSWRYHYYTYANSSGRFSYTPGSAFSDGSWSYRAKARDTASNESGYSNVVSVTIDTNKPKITSNSPSGTIHHLTETLSANYSDIGTGIDTNKVKLKINGAEKAATVTPTKVSYRNTFPNSNRTYNISVEVTDRAGNKTTKTWQLAIQVVSHFMSAVDSSYRTSIVADWPNTRGLIPAPRWWDMGFNDSGWSRNVYAANLAPNSTPRSCSECAWIWGDSRVNPNETTLFRKRFSIPAGVTVDNAAIRMSADDEAWGFVGYVNGNYFGKVPEAGTGNNPYTFGLERFLRAGTNLLAIQTSNGPDNRAGLSYTMTVRYHD